MILSIQIAGNPKVTKKIFNATYATFYAKILKLNSPSSLIDFTAIKHEQYWQLLNECLEERAMITF